MMDAWLQQAIDFAGITQSDLSRRMTIHLKKEIDRGELSRIDRGTINKVLKGTRQLKIPEMIAVSEITKFPLPGKRSPQGSLDIPLLEELMTVAFQNIRTELSEGQGRNLAQSLIEASHIRQGQSKGAGAQNPQQILASSLVRLFSRI